MIYESLEMNIKYPTGTEVIVAIVRSRERYEVRMVIDRGLSYMYFVDESGDSYGKHSGYKTFEEALEDIRKLDLNPK